MSISPIHLTQSGTYTGTHGTGNFSRSITGDGAAGRTVDTTFTRADGSKVTREVTTTRASGGGYTRSVTTVLPNGKSTTLQETFTKKGDGSYTIAGTFADLRGHTEAVSGTLVRSGTSAAESLNYTDGGKTRTSNIATTRPDSNHANLVATGTGFNNQPFSDTLALTILQTQ